MITCGDKGHEVFQHVSSLGLHPSIDPRARGDCLQASTLATGRLERPRSRPPAALVHESATTMGASTLSDPCLRPRRHHGNSFSRCLQLSSTRAQPQCERPHSVLTLGHHRSMRTWRSRNRWNLGSSGSCHQTSHTTCKFGRRGYDWADEAPGRRKSCSRASAIGSICPRGATS